MPWQPDGQFIRQNTDFSGATVWQQDQQATIKIIAARHDDHDQDLASGIQACLNLDGYNAMRADLNMDTNGIINVADGVNPQDAATKAQVDLVQDNVDDNDLELADHEARISTIEAADPFVAQSLQIGGEVNQLSELITGNTGLITLDPSDANRWLLSNEGTITLNIIKPVGVRDIGPNYTIEGTIIVTNGAAPGVITLQSGGVPVPGGDILGSNPISGSSKYLLTYIMHNRNGAYTELFVWSAV